MSVSLQKPDRNAENGVIREYTPEHIAMEPDNTQTSNSGVTNRLYSEGDMTYKEYTPIHIKSEEETMQEMSMQNSTSITNNNNIVVEKDVIGVTDGFKDTVKEKAEELGIWKEIKDALPYVLSIVLQTLNDKHSGEIRKKLWDTFDKVDETNIPKDICVTDYEIETYKRLIVKGNTLIFVCKCKHKQLDLSNKWELHSPIVDFFCIILSYMVSPDAKIEYLMDLLNKASEYGKFDWFLNYRSFLYRALNGERNWGLVTQELAFVNKQISFTEELHPFVCQSTLKMLYKERTKLGWETKEGCKITDETLLWLADKYIVAKMELYKEPVFEHILFSSRFREVLREHLEEYDLEDIESAWLSNHKYIGKGTTASLWLLSLTAVGIAVGGIVADIILLFMVAGFLVIVIAMLGLARSIEQKDCAETLTVTKRAIHNQTIKWLRDNDCELNKLVNNN